MSTLINPMRDYGLASVFGVGAPTGALIYVNGAGAGGSDDNDGLAPGRPKLTITNALTLCTDDGDVADTIVCLGSPGDAVFPIEVNKAGTSIIGAPSFSYYPRVAVDARTAVEDVFDIQKSYVSLRNLTFYAGAAKDCVSITAATVFRVSVIGCNFFWGAKGFYMLGTNGDGHYIARNWFCRELTSYGIHLHSTHPFVRIENNVFDEVQDIACYLQGAVVGTQVIDNIFNVPSNTAGLAITIAIGSSQGNMICGNRANYGPTTMSSSPFRDLSGGLINNWMANVVGDAYAQPAVA